MHTVKMYCIILPLAFCTSCSTDPISVSMESSSSSGSRKKELKTEVRVNDIDCRERVSNRSVRQAPHKSICSLILTTPNGKTGSGTGWLIGPNKVYTAGHCLYSHNRKIGIGWMKDIVVIPGRYGKNSPFGEYKPYETIVHPAWRSDRNNNYDMGAILLSSDVRRKFEKSDYFDVNVIGKKETYENMTVCGYPGDLPEGKEGDKGKYQYKGTGDVSSVDRLLFYRIDTYKGQSGGPVYNSSSIGIHTGSSCSERNRGVAIDEKFNQVISEWEKN